VLSEKTAGFNPKIFAASQGLAKKFEQDTFKSKLHLVSVYRVSRARLRIAQKMTDLPYLWDNCGSALVAFILQEGEWTIQDWFPSEATIQYFGNHLPRDRARY
jgi:hypothetical protein